MRLMWDQYYDHSCCCASLRYLQENRVACEMGLYYVLHIAKLRNKNALQRLLPALGNFNIQLFRFIVIFILIEEEN